MTWIVPRVLPDPDFPLGGASRDESNLQTPLCSQGGCSLKLS